jgi:hypothetical protein
MPHCLVKHHITDYLAFVLASTGTVMMCPANDNPVSCRIHHAIIHFLHAENMNAAQIHRELCTVVYGKNVTNERPVQQW